jgi:hypothetical protein
MATAPQASFNGAFPLKKVWHYSSIFMRESVDIMLRREASLERLFDKVFTDRRPPVAQHKS